MNIVERIFAELDAETANIPPMDAAQIAYAKRAVEKALALEKPLRTSNKDCTGSDLLKLAERCESATGPNFRLEQEIWAAAVAAPPCKNVDALGHIKPPAYTASIDAAMSLVPDDWEWQLENTGGDTFGPFVAKFGQLRDIEAKTLPLAICAAALRARSEARQS